MFQDFYLYILLSLASFVAGFFDAIAGGGGLITFPALLHSGIDPILALGTNKLQSMFSEASAIWYFSKQKEVRYKLITYSLIVTAIGSTLGVMALSYLDIKKAVPFILLVVLIYYLWPKRKNNAAQEGIQYINFKRLPILALFIGFYNGFFGPCTGSIWSISLMKLFHLNIKQAAMYTKPLNFVGNLSALVIFLYLGYINIPIAIMMGISGIFGGIMGAKFVIYKDSKVIKTCFVTIMVIIICSVFYKYYFYG